MKRIKAFVSIICSSLLLVGGIQITALANEENSINVIPCTISWYSDFNGNVPAEINYNGVCVEFSYDENMMRQSKTVDGELYAEYTYNEGRLISERKSGYSVEYYYVVEGNTIKPSGFCYQGNEYAYEFEDGFIKYIMNSEQESIAEYVYDVYGRHIDTIHYNEADNNENMEPLPENINSLVGRGYVFDKETGFYYMAGLYYSPLIHTFLQKDKEVEFIESGIAPLVTVEDNIEAMYSNLMNDYNHGYNIQYSGSGSGWTLYLSDGEILSRLIYGECTYADTGYSAQRAAIAWVVRNRMDYPGTRFPSTARGVAIQSGEFAVISGTTTDTVNARLNIAKSSTAWSEATLYACTILCTTSVDMNGYLVKPTGITTQKFFLSKGSWDASYNAVNQTVNNNAVTDISQYVGNLSASAKRNIFFNFVNI